MAVLLQTKSPAQSLKIIVAGGHPGDPECGCAGTMARFSDLGHEVVVLYLNRGEGYCGSAALDRCAAIRTAEAQSACRILKARSAFAGQVDGRAIVDPSHYEAFAGILAAERPDLVLTLVADRSSSRSSRRLGAHPGRLVEWRQEVCVLLLARSPKTRRCSHRPTMSISLPSNRGGTPPAMRTLRSSPTNGTRNKWKSLVNAARRARLPPG